MLNKYKTDGLTTCVRMSATKPAEMNVIPVIKFEDIEKEKAPNLLSPVCCFTVSSDNTQANEKGPTNFPPQISVIIDPPSPSLSIESHQKFDLDYKLDPQDKQYSSGGSMERCKSNYD